MNKNYVVLFDNVIFKKRYNDWFFIKTKDSNERYIVGKESEKILISLFKGNTIGITSKQYGVQPKEMEKYLESLASLGLVYRANKKIISADKCFNVYPPIDAIDLQLTNSCNLRCSHCFTSGGNFKKNELSGKEWVNIISQAQKIGVFKLNISGGEALLHKDFSLIAEYLTDKPFEINLNTNGTITIDKHLAFLKSIYSVQVSIDSDKETTHDKFRGVRGSFKKSIKTIETLILNGVNLKIASSLGTNSLSSIDGIISICEKMGVSGLRLGLIAPAGRGLATKDNSITYNTLTKNNNELLNKYCQKFYELSENKTKTELSLPFSPKGYITRLKQPKKYICGGDFLQMISIKPDGCVLPCGVLNNNFSCGNVKIQTLMDIWKSKKMKSFKLKKISDCPGCGRCVHSKYCNGPCMVMMNYEDKNLNKKDRVMCSFVEKIAEMQ